MEKTIFTFEQLPQAMSLLYTEMQDIKNLLKTHNQAHPDIKKPKNIKEAAEFLELSVATIYGLVSKGTLPHAKKGKRLYFDEESLAAWVKSGQKKTAAEIQAEATSILRTKNKKG